MIQREKERYREREREIQREKKRERYTVSEKERERYIPGRYSDKDGTYRTPDVQDIRSAFRC